MTVFSALFALFLALASGRFEIAIPLAASDEDARHLRALTLGLLAGSSALLALGRPFYSPWLASVTNTQALLDYAWLLPLGLFAAGVFQVLHHWAIRAERFALMARATVLQPLGQVGTQLALGVLQVGALGLILGVVLGRTLGSGFLLEAGRPALRDWSLRGLRLVAWTYRRFPLYTSWGSFINILGTQSPPLLLAAYFSTEVAGFFGLTMRVLALPILLIGQAVYQVFYPRAANLSGAERRAFVERTATSLLVVSTPVFAAVMLLGPQLFTWVFGEAWRVSGVYAQYLAPWLLVALASSPLSALPLIYERNRAALLITILETGLRLGGLWVGIQFGSPLLGVALFAGAGLVITASHLAWTLSLAGSSLLRCLRALRTAFVPALTGATLITAIQLWSPLELRPWLTAAALASVTVWLWLGHFSSRAAA